MMNGVKELGALPDAQSMAAATMNTSATSRRGQHGHWRNFRDVSRFGRLLRRRVYAHKWSSGMLLVCGVAFIVYALNLYWMKSLSALAADQAVATSQSNVQPLIFPITQNDIYKNQAMPVDGSRLGSAHRLQLRQLEKAQAEVRRRQAALERARAHYLRIRSQLAQNALSGEYADGARSRVEQAVEALVDAKAKLEQLRNDAGIFQNDGDHMQARMSAIDAQASAQAVGNLSQ